MDKISSIAFLICLSFFNIFPKGCAADTCSFSHLRSCELTYTGSLTARRGTVAVATAVRCSAANIFIRCAERVLSDCQAKPYVTGVDQIISKAKLGIDSTRRVLSGLTCGNGAGIKVTSLITMATGFAIFVPFY
ncbi:uncharacterized protein LOC134254268 [Saccostrea cucullata]|uniref:uncharacterized protein LOC134254268 n=1 Tax=Saccostrea cuccullata TaxID=36930 RepID=UPI002ED463D1